MKMKSNIRKAVLHVLAWVAAFFINIILIQGYSVQIDWTNTLVSWGFYLLIFYVNYLVLVPRLLRRGKGVLCVLFTLALLAVSFVSIKETAIKTARNNTHALAEVLLEYEEEKEAFNEKERVRDLQREIERMREREKEGHKGRGYGAEQGERRGMRDGQGPRGRGPVHWGTHFRPDSLMADSLLLDSLFKVERVYQDSILAVNVSLNAKEEEYGRLRREYERTRAYARWLSKSDYNPFSQHNLQFIFALIFFYMASIVIYFAEQTGKEEKRRREMEKERSEAELAYLKQQINPHFLFNTLNSIYSYTIGVSEEASDAVLKLSSILRYMLYETNRDRVPLKDELDVIDSYIDLQRLRTTDKTDIQVIVNGNTQIHRIEPMLLIPIIENAFKYGVDSVEPSFIKIEIDVEQDEFVFRVTNKVVRKSSGDKSSSGIGLQNIRRRLDLIYGGSNYDMDVKEENGIFSVTLRLNLKH